MSRQTLYRIQNLSCQYATGPKVLEIEDLTIPAGELIFVVGISGVGKSTFIETLGLMNNTMVAEVNATCVFTPSEGPSFDLVNIWKRPSSELATLRRQYLSFIFQQTNLMPNFSVFENISIGMQMMEKPAETIEAEIKQMVRLFDIEEDKLDKKVYELSGGQRQRLAFIRAVTADFEVLLGDEPTGNLDPQTARKLMRYLAEMLQEKQKTGLIVSHDLGLAVEFAHRIIVITPHFADEKKEKYFGRIIHDNQLYRNDSKQLVDVNGQVVADPADWIHERLGKRES